MTSIAHIFPASTFFKFTLDAFETAAPGTNRFLVFGSQGMLDIHAPSDVGFVATVVPGPGVERQIDDLVAGADIVIAHSMNSIAARAFTRAPAGSLRVWSGWGGDYYGSLLNPSARQLGPRTSRIQRGRTSFPGKLVNLRRRLEGRGFNQQGAALADIFSAPVPEDFDVFRRRFRSFNGGYAQLNYASVEDSFAVGPQEATGEDIFVGNSATPSNNHLEVFETLARSDLGGRRVIVPLSYGDPDYAKIVLEQGKQILGSAFEPVLDYMPFDEYQRVLGRCGVVVMGHRRQQGLGNIGSALWRGARVILDRRSTVTAFLRSRGADVSVLDDLETPGPSVFAPLSHESTTTNRRILMDFWGRERVYSNIRDLIELAR